MVATYDYSFLYIYNGGWQMVKACYETLEARGGNYVLFKRKFSLAVCNIREQICRPI